MDSPRSPPLRAAQPCAIRPTRQRVAFGVFADRHPCRIGPPQLAPQPRLPVTGVGPAQRAKPKFLGDGEDLPSRLARGGRRAVRLLSRSSPAAGQRWRDQPQQRRRICSCAQRVADRRRRSARPRHHPSGPPVAQGDHPCPACRAKPRLSAPRWATRRRACRQPVAGSASAPRGPRQRAYPAQIAGSA